MNILDQIKNDHDRMRALLEKLMNNLDSSHEKRSDIIRRLRDEVIPHARAEEAVLYNSMRKADAPTDLVYHGFGEHAETEVLLRTLEAMEVLNVEGKAVAERLHDRLSHHLREEEEDLFPEVKAAFDKNELEDLGAKFKQLKPEYREHGVIMNTVDFVENLIPPNLTDKISDAVTGLVKPSESKSTDSVTSKH